MKQNSVRLLICVLTLTVSCAAPLTINAYQLASEPPFTPYNAISFNGNSYKGHESTPIVLNGVLYYVSTLIPYGPYSEHTPCIVLYNTVTKTKECVGCGYAFASAFIDGGVLYIFGTQQGGGKIYIFKKVGSDWEPTLIITNNYGKYYNHSVTRDELGYIMAVETDEPAFIQNSVLFFRSYDLITWTKMPPVYGVNRYIACPTIRYYNGWYYIVYLAINRTTGVFFTRIARTNELLTPGYVDWYESNRTVLYPGNPVGQGQINTSDFDMVDRDGTTICVWIDGDQSSFGSLKEGTYAGTQQQFCESFFP